MFLLTIIIIHNICDSLYIIYTKTSQPDFFHAIFSP